MKILANRESLLEAMSSVWGVVPSRSPKPILQNVKLVANGGESHLIATDLEVGVTRVVWGIEIDEPGAAILSARFLSILKTCRDEELSIEVNGDQIRVRGTSNDFKLTSEDPDLFPTVPEFDATDYFVVPSGPLRSAIRLSIFAIDEESTRYAMGGLLWEFDGDTMTVVGTDGRRLAASSIPIASEGSPADLINNASAGSAPILPAKALKLLDKFLSEEGSANVSVKAKNSCIIRTENADIYARLVEGRYPHYQDVFPEKGYRIEIPAAPFLGGLLQAAIATSDESRGVDLFFGAGSISMKGTAADVGNAEIEVPVSSDGTGLGVTFDPQYLIPMLRALPEEAIIGVDMQGPKHAVLFTHGESYKYVIMPLTRDR